MTSEDCGMLVHSRQPYNAEPPLHRLGAAFITPQPVLYVRSHGEIPALDAARHTLSVGGLVGRTLQLTLSELQAGFAHHSVVAVLQCAGNRRADLVRVAPVSGDPWAAGAIGNATWTGARLADVLRAAQARGEPGLHVAFAASDECEMEGRRFRYGASIPLAKALSPDVLLAWAINGEPLALEHGYPLRVVVPGFAGVRSPKWLAGITVQDHPSDSPIQAEDYKLFPPDVSARTADPARGMTIDEMPLNAAICVPAADARLPAGRTVLRGYAIATDRAIARVDVSADDGRTWRQADLDTARASRWSWVLWQASLDLPAGGHVLAVRACDSAGQTQPARPEDIWNY